MQESGAHSAPDYLGESLGEWHLFLIERGVFGDNKNYAMGVAPLELDTDVLDEELVRRDRQAVSGINIFEVSKLVDEFAAQSRLGNKLAIAIPFAALDEGRDE
jgi:hypothetical protein